MLKQPFLGGFVVIGVTERMALTPEKSVVASSSTSSAVLFPPNPITTGFAR